MNWRISAQTANKCSHAHTIGMTCWNRKVWYGGPRHAREAALITIKVVLADGIDDVCVVNCWGASEIVVDNYQK